MFHLHEYNHGKVAFEDCFWEFTLRKPETFPVAGLLTSGTWSNMEGILAAC